MTKEERETREKLNLRNIAIDWLGTEHSEGNIQSLVNLISSFIEPREKQIKHLGERCTQLLKDKGDLTDRVSNQAESLRVIMLEEEKKRKRIEELEKENAELKEELKDANEKVVHLACNQNKDLKHKLTKATEIIREIMKYDIPTLDYEKAEQFLKEIEK